MAAKPTFDELMAESRYAGPRRTPILDTPAITKAVVEWFQNKSKWRAVETEMELPTVRRADVIAFNPTDHEFYIIEVKAQWNDFVRDRKFRDYRKWCDWFAFAVPEELAACVRRRMEDIPGWYEGVGLLVIPNDFSPRRMVRRPTRNKMTRSNYVKMAERWGKSCWGRLIGLRNDKTGLQWCLENAKSDNIQLRKKLRQLGDSNPILYPQPE